MIKITLKDGSIKEYGSVKAYLDFLFSTTG